jgi:hypothetical protein
MKRKIDVHEATVTTATIRIRILEINGRQITLANFRQLDGPDLLHPTTGELLGTPWGRVNYWWQGCGPRDGQHLHIIWDNGDELYRACAFPDRPQAVRDEEHAATLDLQQRVENLLLNELRLIALTGKPLPKELQEHNRKSPGPYSPSYLWHPAVALPCGESMVMTVDAQDEIRDLRYAIENKVPYTLARHCSRQRVEDDLRRYGVCKHSLTEDGVADRLRETILKDAQTLWELREPFRARDAAWRRNYQALAALKLLLIA